MMRFHEEKGLAVCGLACALCSEEACPGCQQGGCTSAETCSIYQCASDRGLASCYLCTEFPCTASMFEKVRVRAFNRYAKEKGINELMARLQTNSEAGIIYHRGGGLRGDYDLLENEEDVMDMIEYGRAIDPYVSCPMLETDHFLLRLVQESDAEDLLRCYSDPEAERFFNADNCTSNFCYTTKAQMRECIRFWLRSYQARYFVRWSIIDKQVNRAIGTVEMFADPQAWGVLRVDLAASYETDMFLDELFSLASRRFFTLFGVDKMLTKAIPEAVARIAPLRKNGFTVTEFRGHAHYYALNR